MRRRRLHRRSTRELPSPARKSQQTSWFVQPPPIHVIPEETGQESTKDQTNKPSLHATYKVPSTSRASSTQGFGWSHSTPRGRGLQMTQHEMLDRLKKVLAMTVDLIIFSGKIMPRIWNFICHLFFCRFKAKSWQVSLYWLRNLVCHGKRSFNYNSVATFSHAFCWIWTTNALVRDSKQTIGMPLS